MNRLRKVVNSDLFIVLVMPWVWALALTLPISIGAILWWNHTGQPWVWF